MQTGITENASAECKVSFTVDANCTHWGETLGLAGNTPQLSAWGTNSHVPIQRLTPDPFPTWTATISLPPNTEIQYKYVVLHSDGSIARWEQLQEDDHSLNRTLATPSPGSVIDVDDGQFGATRTSQPTVTQHQQLQQNLREYTSGTVSAEEVVENESESVVVDDGNDDDENNEHADIDVHCSSFVDKPAHLSEGNDSTDSVKINPEMLENTNEAVDVNSIVSAKTATNTSSNSTEISAMTTIQNKKPEGIKTDTSYSIAETSISTITDDQSAHTPDTTCSLISMTPSSSPSYTKPRSLSLSPSLSDISGTENCETKSNIHFALNDARRTVDELRDVVSAWHHRSTRREADRSNFDSLELEPNPKSMSDAISEVLGEVDSVLGDVARLRDGIRNKGLTQNSSVSCSSTSSTVVSENCSYEQELSHVNFDRRPGTVFYAAITVAMVSGTLLGRASYGGSSSLLEIVVIVGVPVIIRLAVELVLFGLRNGLLLNQTTN